MFIRGFNALQLTTLFAVWPFLCLWVKDATFTGNGAVFWIMIIGYVIGFAGMVVSVYDLMDRD